MRHVPLAAAITALLSSSMVACSGGTEGGRPNAAAPGSFLEEDGDRDYDDGPNKHDAEHTKDDDAAMLAEFGTRPTATEENAVDTLVRTYYRAAATNNGAKACSLLAGSLLAGLSQTGGQSPTAGQTPCPTSVTRLFAPQLGELRRGLPTLQILAIRVKGNTGLVELGFKSVPMSETVIQREAGRWRIGAVLYSFMT